MDTAAAQSQTVSVRVQVIDLNSRTLDLVLPTFLPARDLTQRVARDAGLDAFWGDGSRRLYWLRARGRVMGDDESLADLGVVRRELLHLLPQPPAGSQVVEQPPDYPQSRGYSARGNVAVLLSAAVVVAWTAGWGLALSVERSTATTVLPGFALGLLACSLARHLFGGAGHRPVVAGAGLALTLVLVPLALVLPILAGADPMEVARETAPGILASLVGVLVGWLAWWGAVEPLPPAEERVTPEQAEAAAAVACGICGQPAAPEVRMACRYNCGRAFHVGCYQARAAVVRGHEGQCEVCGAQVA